MSKEVIRHCMGCNKAADKNDLLRIAKRKDGTLFFDENGKAGGRGAYICREEKCLVAAKKNRRLNRSLKSAVPDNLYDELEEIILG